MIGTYEVLEAVIALAKATSPAPCGGRIYTHVPREKNGAIADATFPFIHIDNIQHIVEDVQCQDAGTDHIPFHIWSLIENSHLNVKPCLSKLSFSCPLANSVIITFAKSIVSFG